MTTTFETDDSGAPSGAPPAPPRAHGGFRCNHGVAMRLRLDIAAACRLISIGVLVVSSACKGSAAAPPPSTHPDPGTPPPPPASEFICQGAEGTDQGAAPGLPRCPAEKAVTNAHCRAAGLLHHFSTDLCIERCVPPDELKDNECCSLIDAEGNCCQTELDEDNACLPSDPNPPGSPPVRCPGGLVYTCSATACRCR
jgi:hypothetical protein